MRASRVSGDALCAADSTSIPARTQEDPHMHSTHLSSLASTEPGAEQRLASARVGALRASIDQIDEMLVSLIGERQRLARAVGLAKRTAGLPPVDATRETAVTERLSSLGRDHGVPEAETKLLAEQLIRLARTTQGLPVVSHRSAAA
jgi:chorismate mutase